MGVRRTVTALALALALAVASGCVSGPERPIAPEDAADPAELVGLWRVRGAGEPRDTWLRMEAGAFQLWRGAGFDDGGWDASRSTIVATAWGHVGEDHGAGARDADWLLGAHTYRVTEDGWQLLDDDGDPVATMTVDGAPQPIASASDVFAAALEVGEEEREALRAPQPLPEELSPATAGRLTGRWGPAEGTYETDPHVVLHDDGSWAGSDGCNGVWGDWALADAGWLLSTGGPSTAIGCDGAPVGSWVAGAALAGLDGDVLVLLDRDATELGRLERG
ncbi:hypothetical protein SAMN05216184_101424 [Georgenia satyanarayanai]|uniref:META domain-containing protein n=1 Tax=Georgenia satyanarayanai TaxID=860221 RepID=A0A2Y9BV51_9MICO|nr:hypothetical protein [Georgenia satyanarayanai]PYG01959.1 hypothetical protein A8987_101424 [Georgenia satyanarayanai]SSA36762.1 hypothetical protein SAMN05216184_101424 [Georgenia satyanarayanai]